MDTLFLRQNAWGNGLGALVKGSQEQRTNAQSFVGLAASSPIERAKPLFFYVSSYTSAYPCKTQKKTPGFRRAPILCVTGE